MDALVTLSFRIQPLGTTSPDVLAITPALDGLLLTQLIEEFERAQGFEPAGGYEGIVPQNYRFGPLNRHFFVGPLDDDSQGDWHLADRYLLGCTCGEVGCWPLITAISKTGKIVTWDAFAQPHRRERDYTSFGPFHFDFEQYRHVIDDLSARFPEA